MDDRLRADIAKPVDQAQDRWDRRFRAFPGEQAGAVLQCPGELLALPGPRHCRLCCRCYCLGGQRRIDAGDDLNDQADGVTAVTGRALGAVRPPVPVAAMDALEPAAGGARFPDRTADRAVPVLAAPLVGAQVLAALGAGRQRDARRPGRAQGDEQVRDRAGRRRPPVGEHPRVVQQGLGHPAALGPATGHAFRHLRDHRAVQRGIAPGDQAHDDPDRVFHRFRADRQCHWPSASASVPTARRDRSRGGGFLVGIRRPASSRTPGSRRRGGRTAALLPMPP